MRSGRRQGVGPRRRKQRVHGKGPTECWGPWHARRAHVKHALMTSKLPRELPSRKQGHAMRGEGRGGRMEGVRRWWRKRCARGGPDYRLGSRARAERTQNIWPMSVTLEVSQLDMSALKLSKLSKR